MQYTRKDAVDKLLDSYAAYYNINVNESEPAELVARCDFFQHTQGSMLVKNDKQWQYTSEEFIYLFNIEHLTEDCVSRFIEYAREDGLSRLNIGPRHMFSYITPVIICSEADENALKALKKCRISKSFQFSLYGWMEVHTAVLEVNNNIISTNRSGKSVAKVLKSVLYNTKRRRFLK
jgi:hypothetical protein